MPSQVLTSVENNFTKGLITEFTGMNFPENAATECDNTEFTLIGDVLRRSGMDFEVNATPTVIDVSGNAVNTYKWNNVSGDGELQLVAAQVGGNIYFYQSSDATVADPLSNQKLVSTVPLSNYTIVGGVFEQDVPCEFADGNGYLFVFHKDIDPIYCEYSAGTITANPITVQIRDFIGVNDGLNPDTRPSTLTNEHTYNLQNQGWAGTPSWVAQSNTAQGAPPFLPVASGNCTFSVAIGIAGISVGQTVNLTVYQGAKIASGTGTVVSYGGSLLVINISPAIPITFGGQAWVITQANTGKIGDWFGDMANYPSNADQWWKFKTTAEVFDPATTAANVTLNAGDAPKGYYVFSAFNIDRSSVSSVSGITPVTTTARPTNGCWFQGRIWYTGVNARQVSSSNTYAYSWAENIYFSRIVNSTKDFGKCYQENDPTSEDLFDLLSTDGGVITIQGCGVIYKLFPIANGLIVFAANGVWYITGSQGIGFSAVDYTITKLSETQSISTTSYVNVQGLPYFWNEEGIYQVTPSQVGGLQVNPITVGTILSFYNDIPLSAKKNARGAYHPIDYNIQWIYKDSEAVDTTDEFTFNKIMNYNVYNKAFYPYTIDKTAGAVKSILYVTGPGGLDTPDPVFKFFSAKGSNTAFADLHDEGYVDWGSVDYSSYFITGYKLHGQALKKFQIPYIYVYTRNQDGGLWYYIQSIWDYATTGNSGRWSTKQKISVFDPNFSVKANRIRLRGRGLVLQLKFQSLTAKPFNFIGWSVFETQNTGV